MRRVRIEMEYLFRASPAILYQFLTTPACLVRWFCDSVDITEDMYTFTWDDSSEDAELVDDIEEERLRFKWEEADDDEFLEFKMYKSDVTNETILEITDYCDDGDEEFQKDFWDSQVERLRKECGG